MSNEAGEGERILRQLAQTSDNARYELGLRLLKGEDLPKCEAEGFEHLLSAAESKHAAALSELKQWYALQLVAGGILPIWAEAHQTRLKAILNRHSSK